jgi:hypothetical protein
MTRSIGGDGYEDEKKNIYNRTGGARRLVSARFTTSSLPARLPDLLVFIYFFPSYIIDIAGAANVKIAQQRVTRRHHTAA